MNEAQVTKALKRSLLNLSLIPIINEIYARPWIKDVITCSS